MYNEKCFQLGSNRSCIRELFEYGCRRAAEIGRENVYDYSLGNPSVPAPAGVNEAIRAILDHTDSVAVHGYTSAVGDISARQAIAEDLNERYDAGVKPENLFITCGAAPGLTAVFRALATENAEILAVAPFFPEYRPFAEGAGLKFKVVPADVPAFQINLEELEKMLTANTAAIILNSPNNPSGVVYTRQTLQTLAALLERKSAEFGHPIYLVADEPYRELTYGSVEVPFLPTIYPNSIVCYSYSKSLSLPGERIGYIYVPENATDSKALYAAIAGSARVAGHVCAPSLLQKVIARCAKLRPDLDAYDRNRRMLYDALTSYGYEMAKPDGAFYLFIKAPGGDSEAFSEKAKQKDLLVVPGTDFGCKEYFRICYCVKPEMIEKSLPVFKALIEE